MKKRKTIAGICFSPFLSLSLLFPSFSYSASRLITRWRISEMHKREKERKIDRQKRRNNERMKRNNLLISYFFDFLVRGIAFGLSFYFHFQFFNFSFLSNLLSSPPSPNILNKQKVSSLPLSLSLTPNDPP